MSLESPSSVWPYYVEMKNPTFSPLGAVSKKLWLKLKGKIHAAALLYQDLQVPFLKLHFYLLPNDPSLRMAVHEHELKYNTQRIRKPPETKKALTIGSNFVLKNTSGFTICPEDLQFKYLPADMEQQYLELSADDMKKTLQLSLIEKSSHAKVWVASIRKEELNCTVLHPTEEVPTPDLMSHQKAVTPGDHLLDILENLKEEDFRRFKRKLSEIPVRKGYNNIPKGRLEKADVLELFELLCRYYTENYATEVAARVLEKINIKDQAEKLWKLTEMPPHLPKNT
nr:NACHT, LRR and PYD domains-containing protein 1b allele 5-like [Anolis sagrei ordinatus]